jgi:hypothetical protein
MKLLMPQLAVMILALVCMLCGGCLELQQSVELRRDGSAYVTYDYSLPLETVPVLEDMQNVIDEGTGEAGAVAGHGGNGFLNRVAVENFCAKTPGVALRRYTSHDSQGLRKIHYEIEAKNGESAINQGVFGAFRLETLEDGRHRIYAELPQGVSHLNAERTAALKQLTEGMRLRLAVQVPTPIEETTGTLVNHRLTASWAFDGKAGNHPLDGLPKMELIW